jgi:hypothetical protein
MQPSTNKHDVTSKQCVLHPIKILPDTKLKTTHLDISFNKKEHISNVKFSGE